MSKIRVESLHLDIVPEANSQDDLDPEEAAFWQDPVEAEKRYLHLFVHQPGFAENVQIGIRSLSIVYNHLNIFSNIPEAKRKYAGHAMTAWQPFHDMYRLPGEADVAIQMVCAVKRSEVGRYCCKNLEELTRSAVVFNVRFQLGRTFSQEKFFSALSKFVNSRGASTAKRIKIAFWEHDFITNRIMGAQASRLALRDITELSISVAEWFANAEVVALEKRIMQDSEKVRQAKMHSVEANPEEIDRFNDILGGLEHPL